jgi:hypothetical protein
VRAAFLAFPIDNLGLAMIDRPGTSALAPILTHKFRSALAHKSTYYSERNLTATALESSDGSIPVEDKAEARNTKASSSMGVGHA